LSEATAEAAGGKIFTFGSYRLGVHAPGSDIDTLCVVPKHVSREDFFDVFEPMLKELDGVTECSVRHAVRSIMSSTNETVQGVPEAYVPIIGAKIDGIPLDLLMARLNLASIPDDLDLQDDNLLRNLDERCVRSLGGSFIIQLRLAKRTYPFIQAQGKLVKFCGSYQTLTSSETLSVALSFGLNVRLN
jgi:poly(A) polymerase